MERIETVHGIYSKENFVLPPRKLAQKMLYSHRKKSQDLKIENKVTINPGLRQK